METLKKVKAHKETNARIARKKIRARNTHEKGMQIRNRGTKARRLVRHVTRKARKHVRHVDM